MTRLADEIRASRSVKAWVAAERAEYAGTKYATDADPRVKLVADMEEHPHLDGEWEVFLSNYMSRVRHFGLDTPQGRQACGKALVTLTHLLETAVLVHGPMPAPGLPSGEIQ